MNVEIIVYPLIHFNLIPSIDSECAKKRLLSEKNNGNIIVLINAEPANMINRTCVYCVMKQLGDYE